MKVQVDFADPSALSVNWLPVTTGYVGDAANASGITVPPASKALIGPLTFTAPTTVAGSGHKCLLASIQANGEAAPANAFDAPDSYQVAQRNVQFSSCVYPLTNATTASTNLALTLTVTGGLVPTGNKVQVTFDDPGGAWFAIWNAAPGTGFSVTNSGNSTVVTVTSQSVTLPTVPLAAGVSPAASVSINLASGDPVTTVDLGATLTNGAGATLVTNGGSCTQSGPPTGGIPQ